MCAVLRVVAADPSRAGSDTTPEDLDLLAKLGSVASTTYAECYSGPFDPTKPFDWKDFCHVPIMAKKTGWAKLSEDVVSEFVSAVPRPDRPRTATMLLSESAHVMHSYTYPEFKTKLAKILSKIRSGGPYLEAGSRIVYRQPWSIQEFCIYDTDYAPIPPKTQKDNMERTGVGPTLSDPQSLLHSSLILDTLVIPSNGTVGYVEDYWMSKSWWKSVPKSVVGCVMGFVRATLLAIFKYIM
ncbi:hypothetical protein TrST_g2297 [Triparma strigata]|nr:hypothetical protein TrST_g2297 [Triparma strigata]